MQNESKEYIRLVNYHKERATAYKNQGLISKALGKDATDDITLPTLYLIDSSGNPIKKDDDADNSGDDTTPDDVKLI